MKGNILEKMPLPPCTETTGSKIDKEKNIAPKGSWKNKRQSF